MVSPVKTSLKERFSEEFFQTLSELIKDEGYVVYDAEYVEGLSCLRLYINRKEDGTGETLLKDCEVVDRLLTPWLETQEWLPDHFQLEVSSPGVYRKLKKRVHYSGAVGSTIKVTIRSDGELLANLRENQSIPGKISHQKSLKGVLKSLSSDGIFLQVKDYDLYVPFSSIKQAQLDPSWDELMRKSNQSEIDLEWIEQ